MAYKKTRCPHHDYRSRSIYMITLNKNKGVSDFSHVYGRWQDGYLVTGVRYKDNARIIAEALRNIPVNFPEVSVDHYKIMPDHIHFVLNVTQRTSYPLGKVISKFTAECNKACTGKAMWEPGYHDRILRNKGQLRNMIDYIDDNPRRWFIRVTFPDYFSNPHLLNLWDHDYVVYGNFQLLRKQEIRAVKVSRRFSEEEKAHLMAEWKEIIRSNGALISPFIAKDEDEMLNFAIANEGNIILITRNEIRERFKPAGRLIEPCAMGRLLIISTMKGGISPRLSKQEAEEMNSLAKRIASEPLPDLKLRKMEFGRRDEPRAMLGPGTKAEPRAMLGPGTKAAQALI